MVNRVSTAGNYSAILANLTAAENRQVNAENRVSSQKNGNDLKGYANQAETLTAMRTVSARVNNYQSENDRLASKLTTQDQALSSVATAATDVRSAIESALAASDANTLMQVAQNQLQIATSSLNQQYDGKYLFAGSQINTKPVTVTQLSDLTAGPPIASFFQNDNNKIQAKLDDSTTVTTGQLASDIGTPMMTAFQALKAYNDGPSGPLTGKLNPAQEAFLTAQLTSWVQIGKDITSQTAQNGLVQKQVDNTAKSLVTQSNTLTIMIGHITDADMAKAATDLSSAQLSVQASARVLQALQSSSLLELLPAR